MTALVHFAHRGKGSFSGGKPQTMGISPMYGHLKRIVIEYVSRNSYYALSRVVVHDIPDPGDVPFLEIALSEGVPLITGNLKHYPENSRMGCIVVSPKQFIDQFFE
jgi:hypothetical protein